MEIKKLACLCAVFVSMSGYISGKAKTIERKYRDARDKVMELLADKSATADDVKKAYIAAYKASKAYFAKTGGFREEVHMRAVDRKTGARYKEEVLLEWRAAAKGEPVAPKKKVEKKVEKKKVEKEEEEKEEEEEKTYSGETWDTSEMGQEPEWSKKDTSTDSGYEATVGDDESDFSAAVTALKLKTSLSDKEKAMATRLVFMLNQSLTKAPDDPAREAINDDITKLKNLLIKV